MALLALLLAAGLASAGGPAYAGGVAGGGSPPPQETDAGAADPPDAPPTPPPAREKLVWLVLPNASYDSDDKFGVGLRVQVVQPKAGLDPYRAAFMAHAFATTNGYHHHRFRFDLVGLGPQERLRLTGHFAYRAWLNDGYWGVGNATVRDVAYDVDDPEDPARKRYRYALVQPFGQLAARWRLAGPWEVFGSANVRYSVVDATEGSLVAQERPLGIEGGLAVQGIGGVMFDTRDPEITPEKGVQVEVAGRVVTGTYTFGGPFASARGWVSLGPRLVLAQRLMGEYLFGAVPFYEMVHWGGAVPIAGFGGADTLRGVNFGRWRGPGKAVSNTELRVDVLEHGALGKPLRWQLVPFVDAGTVWGHGDFDTDGAPYTPGPDGTDGSAAALRLHPAGGAGVRAIWAESLVGRVDVGVSEDLTDQGSAPDVGFYLVFDHLF